MNNHEIFLQAIFKKCIVKITISTHEKGVIERFCIPFDFGPSRKYKDNLDRYHFYDLDSPEGKHNLSILPEKLISISMTENKFEPENYISWKPKWFIKRDWGVYS
jgi:hypothetical protein